MRCQNCGKENEDDARFCENCGMPLKDDEEKTWNLNNKVEQESVFQNQAKGPELYHEPQTKEHTERQSIAPIIVLSIIAAVLLAAVGIGTAAYLLSENNEKDKLEAIVNRNDEAAHETRDFKTAESEEGEEQAEASDPEQTPAAEPSATPAVTPTVTPTPTVTEQPKEHRYELVIKDCTWEQAWQECRDKGGYLARIETEEEFDALVNTIEANGLQKMKFFLGGRREINGSAYSWADNNNQLFGDVLNSPTSPLADKWMNGEPSFQDGDIIENCLNIFYYEKEKRWVLNDVPNAVLDAVPSYAGTIGYVCEYEN